MASALQTSPRVRLASAAGSAGIVVLAAAMLALGLRGDPVDSTTERLVSVTLSPREPPPPPEPDPPPPRAEAEAPKDRAGAANVRNRASPVVVPPVELPIVLPPPVTSPVAGEGAARNAGEAEVPGPGQGAGGSSDGPGGGGTGGDGAGSGVAVRPQQVRGRLSFRDLPRDRLQPGEQAAVEVRYKVNPNGRVSDCRIQASSRYPDIDVIACRLIERRYVFRPARDRDGKAVAAWIGETHTWYTRPEPRR